MNRTNLVLDKQILEEATRLSGEKTYSAAVQRALLDFVNRAKAGKIMDLRGTGLWQGSLAEMRRYTPSNEKQRKKGASADSG